MRIKDACKETGLTDKAIRLYINSELLHPHFQEGYNGRRNYDFNESDIEILKKIALLRRYDFSIQTIKEMLDNDDCVQESLENHLLNVKRTVAESSVVLTNLNNAHDKYISNLDDLCDVLNQNLEPSNFDVLDTIKKIYKKHKKKIPRIILLIVLGAFVVIALLIGLIALLTHLFLSL